MVASFILPTTPMVTDEENLQVELIKLYSTGLDYHELLILKQILADFFARKAINEVDIIWDDQNLSDDVMAAWLHEE